MFYALKKFMFKTDHDFVIWYLAHNSHLLKEIILDKSLKLTVHHQQVNIDQFINYLYDSPRTANKHTVRFIYGDDYVWLAEWQKNNYLCVKNEIAEQKHKMKA